MDEQITNSTGSSPNVPRGSHTMGLLLGAFIIFILGIVLGYMLKGVTTQNANKAQMITATQQKTLTSPTQIVSKRMVTPTITQDQGVYTNKAYGFTMMYPKYEEVVNGIPNSCDGSQVMYKLFEDPSNNMLYIAPEIGIEKQINGDCKTTQTTLSSVKQANPWALKIMYARIATNNDLNNLVHAMYGKGCFAQKLEQDKIRPGIANYTIVDSNGGTGWTEPSGFKQPSNDGCIVNFGLLFLYEPSKKLAIISNGWQNGPLWGKNDQFLPTFTFLP